MLISNKGEKVNMKKMSKILAIVLSLVLALGVLPVFAFAEEKADDRVASWKENDALLLDTLFNDEKFVSYKYVSENMKALNTTADVYTAFALYDNAWKNYIDHNVNIDNAEKILLAIIEKAEYSFDDGYVDEIISVLKTASDVNDFIQKVNAYAKIDLFASSGWSTAFDVVNGVIKVGNMYQTYRDKFVEAYARVLSVQKANAYYIDLLQYVADNTDYDVLKTAAENLIANMNASVESVLEGIIADAAGNTGASALNYLAKLALNSNVYTAAALKVYQVGTSVADVLWNTGDTYALIDTVRTTYYFQPLAADYAEAALEGEDSDKALVSVDLLLTTRDICEKALYDLKLAENEGIINKIKSKLYGTIYEEIGMSRAVIDLIRAVLFDAEIDTAVYTRILCVYGAVSASIAAGDVNREKTVYSAYDNNFGKAALIAQTGLVILRATADDAVTVTMDVMENGAIDDWSFTDVQLKKDETISFSTAFTGTPTYTTPAGTANFNDVYVPSEHKTATVSEVVNATTEVTKEKAKSFGDIIKAFFENLFAKLFSIFKK